MSDAIIPQRQGTTEFVRLFLPLALLYSSYGLVLGFVQGGVGPVLLARGFSVAQVGFVAVLFLPLGLAFLWSPFVERKRIPFLPSATGWILLMQAFAATLICIVAFAEQSPLPFLLALGLATTTAMATMDIQFEALVIRVVPDRLRPVAGALKIATFTLGAVLGGGVLVGIFEHIGWTTSFLSIAVFVMAGLLSTGLLPASHAPAPSTRINLRTVFSRRPFRQKLLVTAFYLASCFLLFGLNRIALVDLGVSLERVGWLVGTLAPLLALPVIALSGVAAIRFGSAPILTLFGVLGFGCGLLWSFAAALQLQDLAIGITLAGSLVLAGGYVLLLGTLLRWSSSESPATDYATLYGLGNLGAMIPMAGAGALAASIGWSAYYIIAAFTFALAARLLYKHVLAGAAGDELELPSEGFRDAHPVVIPID